MLQFHIRHAVRNLLKDKLNGTLIIGGFAIGFTAFMLIGIFYMSEHRVNKTFNNSENIYRIYDAKQNTANLNYDLYPALWEQHPEIENACPMEYVGGFPLNFKDAEIDAYARVEHFVATTSNFFDIFSVEVIASLSDQPFATDKSIVISESVANKMYGSVNPLGRTLISDWFQGTISAIIKDLPSSASFKADVIINTATEDFRMSQSCNNGKCWFSTPHFVVLNPSTDINILTQNINQSLQEINSKTDSIAFQSIQDIYLSTLQIKDAHSKGNSNILSIFLVIGMLIVLLSSINYLNFTISKQYNKLKDIGINKTIGANIKNLFSASLIEVSIGILFSIVIAILLTTILLPHTEPVFGRTLRFTDINTPLAISLFIGIAVFVIALNSLAPIYILTKFKITDFLSGSIKRNGKQMGKQVMLTFQLVASITLITVVLIIFKQLDFVKHQDLGFNEEHLLRIDLPFNYKSPNTLKEEMGKLPFITGSTLSDGYPGHIKLTMGTGVNNKSFSVKCIRISNDYLHTMGIKLLEGRDFHLGDKDKVCLMNQEALKKFEWDNYQNKVYKQSGKGGYKVVGIVEDFNVKSLHSEVEPVALLYNPANRFSTLSIRLNPGNITQQLAEVKKVWKQLLPHEPLYFTFYDQYFQALYEKEERIGKSISFFSIIAIVLTCMGILGQILMVSVTRVKEIGIRKVNGAKISEILTLLNKDFLKWLAIAFVIACPIAYYAMNKWLESFAYKTELNWWIFALAGISALGIALITVSWQSWKAATRNPVEALRYE